MSTNVEEKKILITVDLEDWFQVENFKSYINRNEWDSYEKRYERSTFLILDLFDRYNVKATFFILGWNAEKSPHLIREISRRGHEIASHGYHHDLCGSLDEDALYIDLKKSKDVLEDISGVEVRGYRAPSFSVDDRVLKILKRLGYVYDSSFNSLGLNSRYGKISFAEYRKQNLAYIDADGFIELPVSNLNFAGLNLPWGGGGYFRFWPAFLFYQGVKSILTKEGGYNFYLHPWELDPSQPYVSEANFFSRQRHYLNLHFCEEKLANFIKHFSNNDFTTCANYLKI